MGWRMSDTFRTARAYGVEALLVIVHGRPNATVARPPPARRPSMPRAQRSDMVSPPCPRLSAATLLGLALAFVAIPAAAAGQLPESAGGAPEPDTIPRPPVALPADTWGDPGVQKLVERAQAAREVIAEGLESFEGRMWERMYAGVDARGFRRERAIFVEERAGFVRWSADGDRWVRWEGARRDIPIAGLSSAGNAEQARQLASQLGNNLPWGMGFEPGSDRLTFGEGNWALHPLADTAGLHYRYHSGDTLRIRLPEADQEIRLVEVKVEPRRNEFRLLAASLWFEEETGALARAVYRPARPFDLAIDGDQEDASEIPRVFRPIRAEIHVVSVDHGFFEFQWWIPRRFLFEGEASVGRLASFPLSVEWSLTDLDVNQPLGNQFHADALPEGWTRTETRVSRGDDAEADSATIVRVVPPPDRLALSPTIGRLGPPRAETFSPGELRDLEARLGDLLPTPALGVPELQWGLQGGITRFNRVEGLATGIGTELPLPGGRRLSAVVRAGTHAPVPTGGIALRSGTSRRGFVLSVYHDLVGASEWHDPTALGSSAGNLLNGEGPTPWYRSAGASAALERSGLRDRWRAELFVEAHRAAEFGTRFHARRLFDPARRLPPNFIADRGTWGGGRLEHRWQSGVDPGRARLLGRTLLEGGAGSGTYGRGSLTVSGILPVARGWDAALEAGTGGTVGDLPVQRRFYPGGTAGYRPLMIGESEGDAFLLGRAEIARGMPAARIVVFADALRTHLAPDQLPALPGTPGEPGGWAPTRYGAGVGLSVLDGLVRLDFSREVRPTGGWRVHLYFDGLF
jgi:hypothetical protein